MNTFRSDLMHDARTERRLLYENLGKVAKNADLRLEANCEALRTLLLCPQSEDRDKVIKDILTKKEA